MNTFPVPPYTHEALAHMLAKPHRRRLALVAIGLTSLVLLLTGCAMPTQVSPTNEKWANKVCTRALALKTKIHHEVTGLNPSLGAHTRLNNLIGATPDLANQTSALAAQLGDLHNASVTDLGLALLATKACRQLAGLPT